MDLVVAVAQELLVLMELERHRVMAVTARHRQFPVPLQHTLVVVVAVRKLLLGLPRRGSAALVAAVMVETLQPVQMA
jgi:hypothetical protein